MRHFVLGGIGVILLLAAWVIVQRLSKLEQPSVQIGPMQIEGVVTATGISLIRRGTHVLSVHGKALYYLESPTLNLDDMEDQMVTASGTVELNVSDEYLPVLVVESIVASNVLLSKERVFPPLNIAMTIPDGWSINLEKSVLTARLSGSAIPFLTIRKDALGVLAESGQTIRLGGRPASRIVRPDGTAEILVSMEPGVLHIQIIPSDDEKPLLVETLDSTLRSLRFVAHTASSTSTLFSGTGATVICGGAAGILCPSGYYCEVTDRVVHTGRCRPIR